MRGFIFSALVVFGLMARAEAAPHRLRVYPNAGLTIFSIAESPDGFLWLAASDGLYRFDGFHYQKITGYPFSSARFVAFTRDGSLWSGDFEGLTRLRKDRFEIVLRGQIQSLAAYPDGVFAQFQHQLVQIPLDGLVRHLKRRTRRDINSDSLGRLWAVCLNPEQACSIDPYRPDKFQSIELPSGYQAALPGLDGRVWGADGEHATLFENDRPVLKLRRQLSRETARPGPLLPGRNGQLWFLGETIRGLTSKVDFQDRADHDRYSPTSGFESRRGHLWVASLGRGLIEWLTEPQWQRWFPEDFAGEAAVLVKRDSRGSPIVATHKNLYRRQAAPGGGEEKWSALAKEEHRYDGLLPLDEGGFLAAIRNFGVARLSRDGKVVERLKDLLPRMDEYREIARDGKGRFWVGTKRALLRIEGRAGSLHFREERLPEIRESETAQAVDLEVDAAGRLWVGYENGIAWLDDQDRWHKLATSEPVTMIRSFALAGDDIWVAHRRQGAFSRLHRNGERWAVTPFSANAGYTPVDTDFLKRDSRGWIWRGSPEGVFVSDGRHVEPADWIHISLENGLATEECDMFGFFEEADGSVWIAGAQGVSHLRPDASWFDAPHGAPPPEITRVEADGRVLILPAPPPAVLASDTKVLRIDVGTLHASQFRDSPLRYRLLPLSNDWRLSRDGTIEFVNLPAKAYSLEVGYAGNGPSAVGTYPFRIGSAGAWLSWLWTTGLLLAGGALVAIVRYVPRFEGVKFRIHKSVFLLRRRYAHRNYRSPSGAASATNDYSGETLCGRYRLTGIVSRGGFSVVYEAVDLREEHARLVVKVINRTAGREGWVRDRFAHEVAALRSVQHPGVVRILDSWISSAGEPCLTMPFLEGPTLRQALSEVPLSLERAARIVRRVAAALSEVHRHGIIHRDLKPENLILLAPGTDREQPVIIDFGTAGLRTREDELAVTTFMSGSFHYMAPERLTGHYSPASDVFSLGVMILEMLTGKRLADIPSMFSDASFRDELEDALRAGMGINGARSLTDRLSMAYDPDPRRRPGCVLTWSEDVAAAFDQTRR